MDSKTDSNKYSHIASFIFLLVFALSLMCIGIGFHSIDVSYNILHLSYSESQTYYDDYVDYFVDGKNYMSISDEYLYGWKIMFIGIAIQTSLLISLLSKK
jgi:hypothetical protein